MLTPGNRSFWAAPWEQDSEFGGVPFAADSVDLGLAAESRIAKPTAGSHTCIGVIATNAALDKTNLRHVLAMAHDGLARGVRAVHTPFDGDTLFALATATWQDTSGADRSWLVARVGSIAADCVARAVARGVWAAEPLGQLQSARTALAAATKF